MSRPRIPARNDLNTQFLNTPFVFVGMVVVTVSFLYLVAWLVA
jgi:hypothetical protein